MERIFPPTRYDKAPYRTIYYVKYEEDDKVTAFIQLNDDEDNPQWEPVGEFLYRAFKKKLSDEQFIDDCIKEYFNS